MEVLILDTDAGDIPAILATCRTPLPDARNCLAFSTFGFAIGGLPNLIDRCTSRSLSAQYAIPPRLSQVVRQKRGDIEQR